MNRSNTLQMPNISNGNLISWLLTDDSELVFVLNEWIQISFVLIASEVIVP